MAGGSTPIMMGLSTQEWAEHLTDVGFRGHVQEVAQRVIDGMAEEYATGGLPFSQCVEAVHRWQDSYRQPSRHPRRGGSSNLVVARSSSATPSQ